jgi:hypothetical protein
MKMRVVVSGLVQERAALGDNEPIVMSSSFVPRRRDLMVGRAR